MKLSASNLRPIAGVFGCTYLASIPALQDICELPGVGKTNTKYQGGLTIVRTARIGGRLAHRICRARSAQPMDPESRR